MTLGPLPPLIVTLTLDAASQAWFDTLRTACFPPDRLVVGAHVTMFHALPGERETALAGCLTSLCAQTPGFAVRVAGLRFLGHGVAFALQAPAASVLRATIASAFAGDLTRQDRNAWSPHVTVQNKVPAAHARETLSALSGHVPAEPVQATGLALWRYRGGPWDAVGAWSFGGIGVISP